MLGKNSIESNKIRFGWRNVPLDLILQKKWTEIRNIINQDFVDRQKKSGSTNDFNALKSICEADEHTAFITFSSGKMYWCISNNKTVFQDNISKYLVTKINWALRTY